MSTAAKGLSDDIARAKIQPPRRPEETINRDRAFREIEKRLTRKIVTVEAPQGCGKTGLLAETHRRLSEAGGWAVAWVTVGESDDAESLVRSMLEAMGPLLPSLEPAELMALFAENRKLFVAAAANCLADDAASAGREYVLFLDDLGKADVDTVRALLRAVAEYFPANFHVVASGYRGMSEIVDMRFRDEVAAVSYPVLNFTADEVGRVLEKFVPEDWLATHPIDALANNLHRVTEGWPLGVLVYAEALARQYVDPSDQVDERVLGHRLRRFFRESVLGKLPDDLADFVVVTAVPDRFDVELCNALTGRDDAKFVLRELRTLNVFIEQCTDEQGWFRYHPLFHRWLRHKLGQLDPKRIQTLFRTAGDWFAERGRRDEAAKCVLMESDSSFVEALASAVGYDTPRQGESYFDWIALVDPRRLEEEPRLALEATWGYICSGRPQDARAWADVFEACVVKTAGASPESAQVAVRLVRFKCLELECRYEEAAQVAETCLADFGDKLLMQQRCLLVHALAESYMRLGRFDEALKDYLQAEVMAELGNSPFFVALCRMGIIWLRIAQGKLTDALDLANKALKDCPKDIAAYGALRSAKAYVCIEMGRLDEAETCIDAAEGALSATRNVDMLYEAQAVRAHFLLSSGRGAQAFRVITKTVLSIGGESVARSVNLFAYLIQARVARAMGYLPEARTAAASLKEAAGAKDVVYQLAARVALAYAENASDGEHPASDLLESIEQARRCGLGLCEMDLCICAADRFESEGSHAEALTHLNRALRLQAGQGIYGPFLRSGGRTHILLHEIVDVRKSGGQAHQLAKAVLREFGPNEPEGEQGGRALGPQARFGLTDRECEVLELLEAGFSRREIAESLTVSVNTVKSHVSSIYAKLGVNNRIEAFAIIHGGN